MSSRQQAQERARGSSDDSSSSEESSDDSGAGKVVSGVRSGGNERGSRPNSHTSTNSSDSDSDSSDSEEGDSSSADDSDSSTGAEETQGSSAPPSRAALPSSAATLSSASSSSARTVSQASLQSSTASATSVSSSRRPSRGGGQAHGGQAPNTSSTLSATMASSVSSSEASSSAASSSRASSSSSSSAASTSSASSETDENSRTQSSATSTVMSQNSLSSSQISAASTQRSHASRRPSGSRGGHASAVSSSKTLSSSSASSVTARSNGDAAEHGGRGGLGGADDLLAGVEVRDFRQGSSGMDDHASNNQGVPTLAEPGPLVIPEQFRNHGGADGGGSAMSLGSYQSSQSSQRSGTIQGGSAHAFRSPAAERPQEPAPQPNPRRAAMLQGGGNMSRIQGSEEELNSAVGRSGAQNGSASTEGEGEENPSAEQPVGLQCPSGLSALSDILKNPIGLNLKRNPNGGAEAVSSASSVEGAPGGSNSSLSSLGLKLAGGPILPSGTALRALQRPPLSSETSGTNKPNIVLSNVHGLVQVPSRRGSNYNQPASLLAPTNTQQIPANATTSAPASNFFPPARRQSQHHADGEVPVPSPPGSSCRGEIPDEMPDEIAPEMPTIRMPGSTLSQQSSQQPTPSQLTVSRLPGSQNHSVFMDQSSMTRGGDEGAAENADVAEFHIPQAQCQDSSQGIAQSSILGGAESGVVGGIHRIGMGPAVVPTLRSPGSRPFDVQPAERIRSKSRRYSVVEPPAEDAGNLSASRRSGASDEVLPGMEEFQIAEDDACIRTSGGEETTPFDASRIVGQSSNSGQKVDASFGGARKKRAGESATDHPETPFRGTATGLRCFSWEYSGGKVT